MSLNRQQVLDIVFPRSTTLRGQRFTQDTPILVDVWVAFAGHPGERQELLLTPHRETNVQKLAREVQTRLTAEDPESTSGVIYNQSHVLARVTLRELIRVVLPLSYWWAREVQRPYGGRVGELLDGLLARENFDELLMVPASQDRERRYSEDLLDFIRIAGLIAIDQAAPPPPTGTTVLRDAVLALSDLLKDVLPPPAEPLLWNVFCNRAVTGAVAESRNAIKADAAERLFQITCREICWAVIDSGVDATHPAFVDSEAVARDNITYRPHLPIPPQYSRVVRTYDFTRLRDILYGRPPAGGKTGAQAAPVVQAGEAIDWDRIEPLLRIQHDESYEPPVNEHGTHVAGILAAAWRVQGVGLSDEERRRLPGQDMLGICPDIRIYDLRVIDKNGRGDEFTILAALQFVRHLNRFKDSPVVHGANLSLSLAHAVDSFACGATPVCEECNRLASSGVVVVAAAGNRGYSFSVETGFETYHGITITDPGNADRVITVGATHRSMPHKYGVSYFSSRGPTGDGRMKPDLVAPGEKIESVIPDVGWATLDGTSMAAPHVSGAAAMLMARHAELIGHPERIKKILCDNATDLGRERSFQGAGMLDVLRALQAV